MNTFFGIIQDKAAILNEDEFQDKKDEVQNLLSSILISSHKRGRPTKNEMEDLKNAA